MGSRIGRWWCGGLMALALVVECGDLTVIRSVCVCIPKPQLPWRSTFYLLRSWVEVVLGCGAGAGAGEDKTWKEGLALCPLQHSWCSRELASWESPEPPVLEGWREPGAFHRCEVGWQYVTVCGWVLLPLELHVKP